MLTLNEWKQQLDIITAEELVQYKKSQEYISSASAEELECQGYTTPYIKTTAYESGDIYNATSEEVLGVLEEFKQSIKVLKYHRITVDADINNYGEDSSEIDSVYFKAETYSIKPDTEIQTQIQRKLKTWTNAQLQEKWPRDIPCNAYKLFTQGDITAATMYELTYGVCPTNG